jgi:phage I-like protein
MTGLSLATCDRALAPDGGAPAWVHLFPEGQMTGRDGRVFDLADPAALVLAFQSGGIDLPVDFEHQNDIPEAKLNGPVPAAGWIKELRADAGGLWGRVEWTATAAEMIGRKEYRFLSPSFLFHPKTRQIVKLKGAGLVHNPNLYLTALASQDPTMQPNTAPKTGPKSPLMQRLVKLLGLAADADEEAMLAGLEEALKDRTKPDPAEYMPVETVAAMMRERQVERQEMEEGRATEKVNAALRQGYISPAMKGWALSLCRSDGAAFDQFLAASGPTFAHLFKPSGLDGRPPEGSTARESDMEASICSQLGLKPGSLRD